jgi:hypothetical protein
MLHHSFNNNKELNMKYYLVIFLCFSIIFSCNSPEKKTNSNISKELKNDVVPRPIEKLPKDEFDKDFDKDKDKDSEVYEVVIFENNEHTIIGQVEKKKDFNNLPTKSLSLVFKNLGSRLNANKVEILADTIIYSFHLGMTYLYNQAGIDGGIIASDMPLSLGGDKDTISKLKKISTANLIKMRISGDYRYKIITFSDIDKITLTSLIDFYERLKI